ncbi:glycosyltransferase family 25 protein [Roseobacter sp.]|uniref:glycosyltransferase family 25 protein n=1 Tax=Roseobacter sp. TaxID=1907202 RepID=UPI003296D397
MAPRLYTEMINLARADERRVHMHAELAQAGIDAQFFPAFDSSTEALAEMHRQCQPEGPWGLFHTANMAITISHARVWERFLASDADLCLVMEDDVFIAPDLRQWLDDLSWWPADADMVKLERWRGRSLKVLLSARGTSHHGRRVARLLSRHVGAAGYIMTRQTAERFLAQRPFNITVDNLLFNFNASPAARRMTVYQVHPALVEQGNEPDDAVAQTPQRLRPTGWARIRQKLKRGYYEIAYPLPTLLRALTGRARLHQITFLARSAPSGDKT